MNRMTLMATSAMRKQASVQGALNTAKTTGRYIDSGLRWLGRALGAGEKQLAKAIDQKAKLRKLNDLSVGRAYSTDASELLRIKRLQDAEKLAAASEGAVSKAERLAGYGTAGLGIAGLTAGGTALASGKGDKDAEKESNKAATPAPKEEEGSATEVAGGAANENEPKAELPKSNALRNSLLVGGATAAGATVGGLIDRRNRLRGILLGGLIAGGSTGLGLALAGRNNA